MSTTADDADLCSATRSCAREEAILDGTLAVLAETGYERLTMDAVAARARASKATIYRHWSGKAELVASAVKRQGAFAEFLAVPADGRSTRDDLLALLHHLREHLVSSDSTLYTGLIHAVQTDATLAEAVRARVHLGRQEAVRGLGERIRRRGTDVDDATVDLVMSVAFSECFSRRLLRGEPVDDAFMCRLTDSVLLPALERRAR